MHVQHRNGVDLTAALRAAEAAVKEELGYTVALLEKPLYDPDGAITAAATAPTDEPNDEALITFLDQVEAQQQHAAADGGD